MSHSTRIVVVGAGIVGASVAYHLARRGVAVVVIEGVEAGSATGAGAGIICPGPARTTTRLTAWGRTARGTTRS